MTPNEAISIAAARIGDSGFVNITKEEYTTFLNDVAHEIWFRAKSRHIIRQYKLPIDEYSFTIPDKDIIRFGMIQIRRGDTAVSTAELYEIETSPTYIKEKSPQQNIEEGLGLWQDIGDTDDQYHISLEFNNGQYTVRSNSKFADNLILHIYAIVHSPHYAWLVLDTAAWPETPTNDEADTANLQVIWEPFRNVFVSGTIWRAAEQHSRYVKNSSIMRLVDSHREMYYKRYLPDAVHYIHSMKDSTSAMYVRPFHYLIKNSAKRLY